MVQWSKQVSSKHPLQYRISDAISTVDRIYDKDLTITDLSPSSLNEQEKDLLNCCVSILLRKHGVLHSNKRKNDRTKTTASTEKIAHYLAGCCKAHGRVRVSVRDLVRELGMSKRTVDRHLLPLVQDVPCTLPGEGGGQIETDRRRKRSGGMFVCVSKGAYPNCKKSEYVLNSDIQKDLGWR